VLERDLKALLTGEGLCSERDAADCEARHGDWLDWACQRCEKVQPDRLSGRALRIVFLRELQRGGFPFGPDDLSLEDWLGLGLAARIEDRSRLLAELAPWMAPGRG